MLEATSALALWADDGRCAGGHGRRADRRRRDGAGDRGRRGALAAHHQSLGGDRGRRGDRRRRRRELADLEFRQFHPTALALPGTEHDGTLLTEALRGEGAELLDAAGQRFTDELARATR